METTKELAPSPEAKGLRIADYGLRIFLHLQYLKAAYRLWRLFTFNNHFFNINTNCMFHTIREFLNTWKHESASTISLFEKLTDESLDHKIYTEGRTLARLANHITETLSELPAKLELGIQEEHPNHHTAAAIIENYQTASDKLVKAISTKWTDDSLQEKHNLYGDEWKNAFSLWVLVAHQIHHRGQMTVLMRQAGLKIPGLYGPAREEWETMGMKPMD